MKYILIIFIISLLFIFGFGYQTKSAMDLNDKYRELLASYNQVLVEFDNIKKQQDATNAKLLQTEAELKSVQDKLAEVSELLRKSQAERDQAITDKQKLEAQVALLEKDIAALQSQLTAAVDENLRLKSAEETYLAQIKDLQVQRDEALHNLAIFRQAYDVASQTISSLQAEITNLSAQVKDLQVQLQTPPLIRLLKATLGEQAALPLPLYFAIGFVFAGMASSAGVVILIRKTGSEKGVILATLNETRRYYHQLVLRQRGRL